MTWVSLRLSEKEWDRLQTVCRQHGITARSTVEAAITVGAELLGADSADPLAYDRRLRDILAQPKESSYRKVGIRLDPDVMARFRALSRKYDVALNTLLRTPFTTDAWEQNDQWSRIVGLARRMDYGRRTGHPNR